MSTTSSVSMEILDPDEISFFFTIKATNVYNEKWIECYVKK